MTLRTAACAVCLAWAACTGCEHAQTTPTAQTSQPTLASRLAPVEESPKFVLESPGSFFSKHTSDDLMQQR
jgi:hypothetical protein